MAAAFNPFHIFRKYQKSALAAITLLSMFAFVCVGPAMMGRGTGGGANQIPALAKWKYGDILRSDVSEKLLWRGRINRFLQYVHADSSKFDPNSQIENFLFKPENDDGVLRAIVMAKKAELMGMSITDQSINDYINTAAGAPVTLADENAALLKAVGDNKGSPAQLSDALFEALRFELMARNCTILLLHDSVDYATPAERWDYFGRLSRTATVQVLPVAVKDFVDKVATPDDTELQKLFDEGKDLLSQPSLPEPGFRVPSRGQFQYFKAVRATLAKADEAKITDKEIEDYYAAHKENFRKSTLEDSTFPTTDEKPKNEEKPKSGEKPKSEEKPKAETPKTDDKKPATETPKSDTPKTEAPKADAPKTDAPKTDAPKTGTPKTDAPKTDNKAKSGDEPADPKTTDDKSSDARPAAHHLGLDELLALADPDSPPAATPPATSPAPKTDTPKSEAPKSEAPKTEAPKTDAPKTDAPKTEKPNTEASKSAPAKTEPPKTETPKSEAPKTEIAKTPPAKTAPAAAPVVEFEPVSNPKVRDDIRRELAVQKAASEINVAFTKLRPAVQNYSRALSLWRAKGSHPEDMPTVPDFKELAKPLGLSFEETSSMSADEARDQTELGKSADPFTGVPFSTAAYDPNLPLYMPAETRSIDEELAFLWWRNAFNPSYVPAFADAKPDVVRAWKMIHARPLALAAATKDAEEANKRLSTLKEIFQNRANMTVQDAGPFHWLSVGNIPMGDSMRQVTQVTQVPGLDFAEVAFMRTVFTTDEGKAAVAFNQPQTIAYVVQVQKINPPEDVFRRQFQSYEVQSENSRNPGLPYEAAARDAQQTMQAKLGGVFEELGFKRLATPTGSQGSSSAPGPVEEEDPGD